MSDAELRAALEHNTGLPCPPAGTLNERELWAEYEVAGALLIEARSGKDPHCSLLDAVNGLLREHAYPLNELAPHIERALGRKLLPQEVTGGLLYE